MNNIATVAIFMNDDTELNLLPRTKQEAIKCDSQFYFTGAPCSNGHFSKRYVTNNNCLNCSLMFNEIRKKNNRLRKEAAELPFINYPNIYPPSFWKRFWNFVPKNVSPEECWNWMGCIHRKYGYLSESFRHNLSAHRIAYESEHGKIPDKLHVLHKCDNPSCVNPNHLFLGTQSDNNKDCASKGRARNHPTYGENNPYSKLKSDEVRLIREDKITPGIVLAKKYNVENTTISSIRNGKTWKWL